MKNSDLHEYLKLIETRLDIMNTLTIRENKIVPNYEVLNKTLIKENSWDDLFSYHKGKLIFTNRFMTFVGEITDRKVLTGHYHLELREV